MSYSFWLQQGYAEQMMMMAKEVDDDDEDVSLSSCALWYVMRRKLFG